MLYRVPDDGRHVLEPELGHDVLPIDLDRLRGQLQLLCDLLAVQAFGQEAVRAWPRVGSLLSRTARATSIPVIPGISMSSIATSGRSLRIPSSACAPQELVRDEPFADNDGWRCCRQVSAWT